MTNKNLPCYELKIDGEESLVDAIALVENPAIEKAFLAFKDQKKIAFTVDDEKMELLGIAMVPNQLIYRRNEDGFEYNVFFSKDTIRKISQAFFKGGFQSNINIEHSATSADSFVFQAMIADHDKGIHLMDAPDGSLVVGIKVMNSQVWQDIKEGKRTGFSIEGMFEVVKSKFAKQKSVEDEILDLIAQIQKEISKHI